MADPVHVQMQIFDTGTPGRMSQEEAINVAEHYYRYFVVAVYDALDIYHENPNTFTEKIAPFVKGQCVTNLIWANVRESLVGFEGVEFCDKLNFFKLILGNKVIVRFKRLNRGLLAISEATDQAVNWFGNAPLEGIDSRLTRLTFGYQPEENWVDCTNFFLTHQTGFKTLDWAVKIDGGDRSDRSGHFPSGTGFRPPAVPIIPLLSPARALRESESGA